MFVTRTTTLSVIEMYLNFFKHQIKMYYLKTNTEIYKIAVILKEMDYKILGKDLTICYIQTVEKEKKLQQY